MNKLLPTSELIKEMEYFDTPSLFFGEFTTAWKNVKNQVLKLETRQTYFENGKSWEALIKGDPEKSLELLAEERSIDINLYLNLMEKCVEFIRCRPIQLPLSEYIKWEFKSYKINAVFNEKIFFLFREDEEQIFNELALHDFMIFDKEIAFIHDYDVNGEIKGGWKTTDNQKINNLLFLYSLIKSSAHDFKNFIKINKLD